MLMRTEREHSSTREHRDTKGSGVKGEGSRLTRLTDQPSKDPDTGFSRRGRMKRNSLVAARCSTLENVERRFENSR